MTFTDKMCPECHDSGSTTKNYDHGLNCRAPGCEAVARRMAFDNYLRVQRPGGVFVGSSDEHRWAIFKHAFGLGVEAARASLPAAGAVLTDEKLRGIAAFIDSGIQYNQDAPDMPPEPASKWDYEAAMIVAEIHAILAAQPDAAAPDAQPEAKAAPAQADAVQRDGWHGLAHAVPSDEPAMGEELPDADEFFKEQLSESGMKKYMEGEAISLKAGVWREIMEDYGRACMALRPPGAEKAGSFKWDYLTMGLPNEDVAEMWRASGHSGVVPFSFANKIQEKMQAIFDAATAPVSQPAAQEPVAKVVGRRVCFLANGKDLPRPGTLLYDTPQLAAQSLQTVTMTGYQLRDALDFINPDGPSDVDQCESDLTFGIRQHQDDDGNVSTGLCCWNDDTDGEVYPLDGDYSSEPQPAAPAPATLSAEQQRQVKKCLEGGIQMGWISDAAAVGIGALLAAAGNSQGLDAKDDTCLHDDLIRLGAIWTRCEQCGKKWADDEGGVPKVAPVGGSHD